MRYLKLWLRELRRLMSYIFKDIFIFSWKADYTEKGEMQGLHLMVYFLNCHNGQS